MADNKPIAVTPQSAKRIGATTRYVERLAKNEPIPRGRTPAFNNPGVKYAVVRPGGISAFGSAGANKPGTGKATLQSYLGPGHALVATSTIVDVSNAGAAIAAGKVINVAFGDGGWHTVVVPC